MSKESDSTVSEEVSILSLFQAVWARRFLVGWITGAFLLLGLIASLFWPKVYEASATVFPVTSNSGSALSEYAGLAAIAGISLPASGNATSPGKTVNALLNSRLLVEILIDDLDLLNQFPGIDAKTPELKKRILVGLLRKALKSKEDTKTGVITISFELISPELAQKLTNQVVVILDNLLADKSLTANRKKREQLDRQVGEQGKKLSEYQQQMATFQRQTALLNPAAQAGKAVDAYTSMIQQRMELELQLATAQASYSSDNPRIMLLKNQLENLERQIETVRNQVNGDLPSLKMAPENLIKYQNLTRDLEIATKIYAGLLASLEQSKLESDKEQIYIEILDRALLPLEGKPSRTMVVISIMTIGFVLAIILCLVLQWLENLRRNARGLMNSQDTELKQ